MPPAKTQTPQPLPYSLCILPQVQRYSLLFALTLLSTSTWAQSPLILTFQLSKNAFNPPDSTILTIPTIGTGYNYDVDWNNDGIYDEQGLSSDATHDFGRYGTYTIRIRGNFPRIYFNRSKRATDLISIDRWGETSPPNAFG